MGNLWTYGTISAPPADADLVPVYHGSQTKDTAVSNLLKDRVATVTVGFAGADYVCSGLHDGAQILAAINSLPASGGKVLIRNSTTPYDFSSISDRIFIATSNITVEGESLGGVTLQANASLFPGGSDALGQFGMLTIGKNQVSLLSNIVLKNLVFNLNNQLKTAAISIDGSSSLTGQIGVQNVRLDNVYVKNSGQNSSDPLLAGAYVSSGIDNALGNRGYVDKLTVIDCDFGNASSYGFYFQGTNITNVKWVRSNVHDCNRNGVQIFDYGSSTTSSDWLFYDSRFERNMILTSGSSQAHIRDSTQNGINNLTFDKLYFGPTQNPNTSQDYCMTPYWANNLKMKNIIFDQTGSGISLGASIAGTYNRRFPINKAILSDCVFYKSRSCFDPDSAQFMDIKGNMFYKVQQNPIFQPYSEHYPTNIIDNTFYDAHANDSSSSNSNNRAILRLNGDGFVVRGNRFIDDRTLANPVASLGLTQAAGGSLGARTYFVKYTYTSDSGETAGSAEQSLSILANNLLVLDSGSGSLNAPYGATFVNYYVGTSSGAETLQTSISLPTTSFTWTEPTSGLVAGVAIPVSNTTTNLTAFGIYEISGGGGSNFANVYEDNLFYGIPSGSEIFKGSSYFSIQKNNVTNPTLAAGGESLLERVPYTQGNITGAATFDTLLGEVIKATFTGNITATMHSGYYIGQTMERRFTMGGSGSYTYTKASNELLAGGIYIPSSAIGAKDILIQEWDGTNWLEKHRILGIA